MLPQFNCDCTTQLTHVLRYRTFSPKLPIVHIKTTHLVSLKKLFTTIRYLTHQITIFQRTLTSFPHIVNRDSSWKNSQFLYLPFSDHTRSTPNQLPVVPDVIQLDNFTLFYLKPVLVQLYILPTNFQFSIISSSWMTSLYLYLYPGLILLNLLPAKFQFSVISSI